MQFSQYVTDPYPYWAHVRAQQGLVFSTEFSQRGAWLVSRYADCEAVLRDTTHFSVQRTGAWLQTETDTSESTLPAPQPKYNARSLFARALLFTDAPTHTRLRRIMQPLFKPSALTELNDYIAQQAKHAIAQLQQRIARNGQADWIACVAQPLPAKVIAKLIGIEHLLYRNDEEQPLVAQLQRWSRHLACFIGAPNANTHQIKAAQISIAEMADFFARVLQERTYATGGLLCLLQTAHDNGEIDNVNEMLAQAVMMLFAGHETTRNLLGNGLLALLQHRAQWQLLCEQPDIAANATKEMLRWDTPIQYTGRRLAQDCTLAGQALKRNDAVIVSLASANHDADAFTQPQRFDIQRTSSRPLGFGLGIHHCIGAKLTEMEVTTTISALAHHVPALQFQEYTRNTDAPAYRGLNTLIVSA